MLVLETVNEVDSDTIVVDDDCIVVIDPEILLVEFLVELDDTVVLEIK